jgi:tRNA U34 2-thiouridine synthase MnmA/TrmU
VANTITVGGEADLHLFTTSCTLTDWVGSDLQERKKYGAKVRYRQEDQECEILFDKNIIKVIFVIQQRAIAIWQVCVMYRGDVVIGSWIIQ